MLADQHLLFLKGIALLLETEASFVLCGLQCNGKELLKQALHQKPDIIIANTALAEMDGIEVFKEISKRNNRIRLIALTDQAEVDTIYTVIEAGANGVICKNTDWKYMVDAVKTVNSGLSYFCKSSSFVLIRMIGRSGLNPRNRLHPVKFSEREKQIQYLIAENKSSREIADRLGLQIKTIENVRSRMLKKIKARNSNGMLQFFIRYHLFNPDIWGLFYSLLIMSRDEYLDGICDALAC